jgi:hypothetical protein
VVLVTRDPPARLEVLTGRHELADHVREGLAAHDPPVHCGVGILAGLSPCLLEEPKARGVIALIPRLAVGLCDWRQCAPVDIRAAKWLGSGGSEPVGSRVHRCGNRTNIGRAHRAAGDEDERRVAPDADAFQQSVEVPVGASVAHTGVADTGGLTGPERVAVRRTELIEE